MNSFDGVIATDVLSVAPVEQSPLQLRYPHENPDALPGSLIESAYALGQLSEQAAGRVLSIVAHVGAVPLYEQGSKMLYRALNGNTGLELQSKTSFAKIVQRLGYVAPRSVVVKPGGNSAGTLKSIEALDTSSSLRFCKPLNGWQGRGVMAAASPDEALGFVSGQREKYLVQTSEIPEQDWRYILHRDVNQLATGEPPAWRIAYEKVRPKVVGDGTQTIKQLVTAHPEMPDDAKMKYLHYHGDQLGLVPEAGEQIALIQSGNISKGAYSRLPNIVEQENLDRFMLEFLAKLEAKVGGALGTLCVDIGVKDGRVLERVYDEQGLKENIVFYEFQVPFGMTGYTNQLPMRPRKFGTAFSARVNDRFRQSMLASGRMLR